MWLYHNMHAPFKSDIMIVTSIRCARKYVKNVRERHALLSLPQQKRIQLGRHKGGRELLAAVGFCDELRAEAGGRDGNPDGLTSRGVYPPKKTDATAAAAAGNGLPVGTQEKWELLLGADTI